MLHLLCPRYKFSYALLRNAFSSFGCVARTTDSCISRVDENAQHKLKFMLDP